MRMFGPEANTYFNCGVTALAYESLLGVHPTTLEYIPGWRRTGRFLRTR